MATRYPATTDRLSASDLVRIFSVGLGGDAAVTVQTLTDYILEFTDSAGSETQYASPNTPGFTIAVNPVNAGANVFLLMQPIATLASGTIVLPGSPEDGQSVLVSTTNEVSNLTVSGNGNPVNGAPTSFPSNSSFSVRFDVINGSWYLTSGGGDGTRGDKGDRGDKGEQGNPGPGVPPGGLAGQVLSKINGTSYNTEWIDPPSGGGGAGVTDGDKGDVVVSGSGANWAIDAGAVNLSKMANLAAGSVIANTSGSAATPQAVTLAALKVAMVISAPDVSGTIIPITSNRNAAATDNNGTLVFSSSYTLTLPNTLTGFNATVIPPAVGTASIAVSGGATINGGTTTVTRTGSNPFSIIAIGANAYLVTDNTAGGTGDVTTGGVQTLTNKSMSGSANTFTNIPQSAVTGLTAALAAAGGITPLGQVYSQTKTDANTTETTLWTLSIPGGTIGANDMLVVESLWENPSSATQKTFRAKYDGTDFHVDQNTTQTTIALRSTLTNLGVTNSQKGQIRFSGGAFNGTNNALSLTKDTTSTLNLTLTAQWQTAGGGSGVITLVHGRAYVIRGV